MVKLRPRGQEEDEEQIEGKGIQQRCWVNYHHTWFEISCWGDLVLGGCGLNSAPPPKEGGCGHEDVHIFIPRIHVVMV